MMMSREKVFVDEREGNVAYLILNKPERRNALDPEMMDRLGQELVKLEGDDEVKVIVLKGQGDHFCSGGDLKYTGGKLAPIEENRNITRRLGKAVKAIQQIEKPVFAMVNGYALGGGLSLALACDMVLAAEDARFASNFLRLGLTPEMGATWLLPMIVGLHRAKELWFTAKLIDAHEAYRLGIVNRVFPKEKLEEETLALAREVALLPTQPLRITKRIVNATFLNMLDNVLEFEAQATPFCIETKELRERLAAFNEKGVIRFLGEGD